MILNACCVQRNVPVRLVSITALQCLNSMSSSSTPLPPKPALLNSKSRRPNVSFVFRKKRSDGVRIGDVRRHGEHLGIGVGLLHFSHGRFQALQAPAGKNQ